MRSFIHIDKFPQGLFPNFRPEVHHTPFLEGQVEVLDAVAVVNQGLGGIDCAVHAFPQRQGVDFLRRHIGSEGDPRGGSFCTTCPDMSLRQRHRQVGAQAVPVVQALEILPVQELRRPLQGGNMLLPGLGGVFARLNAHRAEDFLPEPGLGLLLAEIREDLLRPACRGHGHHAPGILVIHEPGPVFQQGCPCRLGGEGELLRLDVLEYLRVAGGNGHESRPLLGVVLVEPHPPVGEFRENLLRTLLKADMGQLLVAPAHHHIVSPRLESLGGDQAGKFRTFKRGIYHQQLVMLKIHPHLYH